MSVCRRIGMSVSVCSFLCFLIYKSTGIFYKSTAIPPFLQRVAVCCSVLPCVVVCGSVWQCVAAFCIALQYDS